MNSDRFNEIANKRFAACKALLVPKGDEYARDGDRLHNFKRVGAARGQTPGQALLGMYMKHWASVCDIVDDLDKGEFPSAEVLAEKISDSINYHVLLEAVVEDMREVVK